MGLDITANGYLRKLGETAGEWEKERACRIYVDDCFLARIDDLDRNADYYAGGDTIDFRAGSYSGYNRWREMLAGMLGTTPEAVWADPKPGPFVDLIHFSYAEGVIGPKTSEKLANDFASYWITAQRHADTLDDSGQYFLSLYKRFWTAFDIASGEGWVRFH